MSSSVIIEIFLGALSVGVGYLSYRFAVRAHHAQAQATQAGVDASAFTSAKEIYAASVAELREQVTELRAEITRLRESNSSLEASNRQLERANSELRQEVWQLHAEVASLRNSRA